MNDYSASGIKGGCNQTTDWRISQGFHNTSFAEKRLTSDLKKKLLCAN